ncbi:hypothetical protein JHK82_035655 [Glycine max]|nr:hypothetical protein GLYMA_13G083033v4 [Glycine max]KAG4976314.1 hypothetical protein JHK86_035788 [Glycine max]KAG5112386.1 hypothetical protein JHK82_035655 [Glycine max]KAH1100397.1 hypothetical protein GYH30_035527 [Glycine max]
MNVVLFIFFFRSLSLHYSIVDKGMAMDRDCHVKEEAVHDRICAQEQKMSFSFSSANNN